MRATPFWTPVIHIDDHIFINGNWLLIIDDDLQVLSYKNIQSGSSELQNRNIVLRL